MTRRFGYAARGPKRKPALALCRCVHTRADRFVRYSMGIPTGYTPSIPLMLSRLMARGLGGKTRASMVQEAFPFPAMTTDSRHVILVHVAIDGNGTKEDAETAGDGNEGSGRR